MLVVLYTKVLKSIENGREKEKGKFFEKSAIEKIIV